MLATRSILGVGRDESTACYRRMLRSHCETLWPSPNSTMTSISVLTMACALGAGQFVTPTDPRAEIPIHPTLQMIQPPPAAKVRSATDAAALLATLLADHEEWQRREYPQRALERGDDRFAARLTDHSLAAYERRRLDGARFLERARAIDVAGLNGEELEGDELDSLRLFIRVMEEGRDGERFRAFLMPFEGPWGPHTAISQLAEGVRFDDREAYLDYLTRLEQVPTMIAQYIELLRLGVAEGRTPPRVTIEDIPGGVDLLLEGGLGGLERPLERMPASVSAADRELITSRFHRESIPKVRAGLEAFGRFLRAEYVPACRESIAASALPEGAAFYDHCLKVQTTTDLSAREIHEIGLGEVARLRREMLATIRQSDFLTLRPAAATFDDAALFAAFIAYLRSDPRFYHTSEAELVREYRDICKRVDGWLPSYFRVLPRLPYGVKPMARFMAPTQTTAYYQPGDFRSGEPGWYVVNTYRLDMRPRYEMIALSLHEAVPGHHLQIALARELEHLPEFRRSMQINAYVEGWALYAERLGVEAGMYADPYDDFGRLLFEMWRACRLVIDTGIHAFGWTRDQAIAFLRDNTALSELNVQTEIDRYIGWPGQACGYKLGELRLTALRGEAEARLGAAFDVREFHEVVLGGGALPLDVLEARIQSWIARRGG